MTAREKLMAELAKIIARGKKREDQARVDRQREHVISAALWRFHMAAIVGIPNAVMTRYRGQHRQIPDDVRGTLVKIGRTHGSVDFGEHGRWSILLIELISFVEQDKRGLTLQLGGMR